ncbi:MAG: family 2 glycosyl transferase [Methanobacterium sp.]|nr:family 2 glycosyl transferase [Methanobacterium sp.]
MITVICVHNNQKILDDVLLKSLKQQNIEYELILIDNSDGKYKSAAEALNYGAKKAKNEIIMFVHQDVDLSYPNCLRDIEGMVLDLDDLGVAGVAGYYSKDHKKPIMYSNIKDGCPPKDVGVNVDHPIEVQTVDECLFIVPRSLFNKLEFDEKTCPDWHLYGADYCLDSRKLGKSVYIIPIEIYHVSRSESFSESYYTTLKNVVEKHRDDYKTINTSCGIWRTGRVGLGLNIIEDRFLRFMNLR